MEEATKVFSAKILQKNIEALKKLMTDIQTYVTLEETREEHYPLFYFDDIFVEVRRISHTVDTRYGRNHYHVFSSGE